jgi:molecular chaperone IbpA
MTQLVRFDTNTLNRVLIGVDHLLGDFESRFANQISNNYPPHNVVKTGDTTYELRIAVTGFDKDEITVEVDQDQLIIKGESQIVEDEDIVYLHRGLATRDFHRVFPLADHVEVETGSIRNGILTVYLKRVVPETLKPRRINLSAE